MNGYDCIAAVVATISVVTGYSYWLWLDKQCQHKWGDVEAREYPAPSFQAEKLNGQLARDLVSSCTTYRQRCEKCGLEKYHTERRP